MDACPKVIIKILSIKHKLVTSNNLFKNILPVLHINNTKMSSHYPFIQTSLLWFQTISYPDTCLFFLSHYHNKPSLCPPPQWKPVHNKPPVPPPKPQPASPSLANIYAVARLPHSPRGQEGCGAGGWLTAVPERMLRDDGWPSRYVMS